MTLSFSQNINGKLTYFPEKIWSGLKDYEVTKELISYLESPYASGIRILDFEPKIHTIRTDTSNRWSKGKKIHFVINDRTKNRLQFAPTIECKATQDIWISPINRRVLVWQLDTPTSSNSVWDGYWKQLSEEKIHELLKNDGFDNECDFWNYFNKEFGGKIIHWTDYKY